MPSPSAQEQFNLTHTNLNGKGHLHTLHQKTYQGSLPESTVLFSKRNALLFFSHVSLCVQSGGMVSLDCNVTQIMYAFVFLFMSPVLL